MNYHSLSAGNFKRGAEPEIPSGVQKQRPGRVGAGGRILQKQARGNHFFNRERKVKIKNQVFVM